MKHFTPSSTSVKYVIGVNLCINKLCSQAFIKWDYSTQVTKRFYKNVTVAGVQNCYEINLDHMKLKTPNGNILKVPNYPLALAVANEWSSVNEKLVPGWMHLTGLSYTVFDNPQKLSLDNIVGKIMDYLASDTILFRDESQEELSRLQVQEWDPILEWFNKKYAVSLIPSKGISPFNIPSDTKDTLKKYFLSYNIWAATGILYGVEALKSVILSVAALERKINSEKAVDLTLLETQFQTKSWGTVDWAHTVDKYDLLSRFSAAVLFAHLNSSTYLIKQKIKIG